MPRSPNPRLLPDISRASPSCLLLLALVSLTLTPMSRGNPRALLAADSQDTQATVKQARALIAKSLKAYGGKAKILSLSSFVFEYQAQSASQPEAQPLSAKVYFRDTDQFRSEVRDGNLEVVTVLSGNRGWVEVGGTTLPRPAMELSTLRNETLSLVRPDLLLLIFSKYRYSGRIQEDRALLDQIHVSGFIDGEYIRGRLSISVETSLIEKYEFEIERATTSGTGVFRGQSLYLKYSEVEGFKFPAEILSRKTGKHSRITVTAATLDGRLDPDLFQENSSPSRQAKPEP